PGEILDRQPGDARLDAEAYILGDFARVVGIAVLEVGIDRHVGDLGELAVMRQRHVARDGAVGEAERMRVAGRGRRQRLEAEALQIAGAADIPWVGNDETPALVQFAECLALVGRGRAGHGRSPSRSCGTVPWAAGRGQCHSVMIASALLMRQWRVAQGSATLRRRKRRRRGNRWTVSISMRWSTRPAQKWRRHPMRSAPAAPTTRSASARTSAPGAVCGYGRACCAT